MLFFIVFFMPTFQLLCRCGLLLVLAGAWVLPAQAQTNARFSVGLTGSPDFYTTLGTLSYWYDNARPVVGYTVGLEGAWRPGRWWALHVGLRYAELGEQIDLPLLVDPFSPQPDMNLYNLKNKFNILELPIRGRVYFWSGQRLGLFASAGLAPGLGVRYRSTSIFYKVATGNETQEMPLPDNRLTLNVLGGAGAELRIGSRFMVTLEPEYRYYMVTPFRIEGRATRMHAFGIQCGFHVVVR